MSLTDEQLDSIKEFFSYPKHDCPSCSCQCAVIPRYKEVSAKVTILAEKGNLWLIQFNIENIRMWLPYVIVERYFDIATTKDDLT